MQMRPQRCLQMLTIFIFLSLCAAVVDGVGTVVVDGNRKLKGRFRDTKSMDKMIGTRILTCRGGSSTVDDIDISSSTLEKSDSYDVNPICTVLVSTSFGSSFLDKRKRLTINRNATVSELKTLIREKFPGFLCSYFTQTISVSILLCV